MDCANDLPPAGHLTPGYRRALWIVVALNIGFGVIEMGGGLLADSQTLKGERSTSWVLLPDGTGDANARAVWLFSRNDAIGNAAVIVAGGFEAWTGTAWPDLVVAFVIAALFLRPSGSIAQDARNDLAARAE